MTVATVRRLALALTGAVEKSSYGTPGFRVKDMLFARVLPGDESIVVRVDSDVRRGLIASAPKTFAVTPHYQDHPWVIVHLDFITAAQLKSVLAEAWRVAKA